MGNFTFKQNQATLRICVVCSVIFFSGGCLELRLRPYPPSDVKDYAIVTGTVRDELGTFASAALVKGTTGGTISILMEVFIRCADDAILLVSYLGYTTLEVPVNGQSVLSIQLQPEDSQLNEIIVVGYGTQKRSDVTGAIGSLKRENFNRGIVTNPLELLQGQIAGVNVTSVSGEPGANQNVIIRGIGSLRSGTQPLYVLDGFLLDNSDTGIASITELPESNDIESIEC